MKFASSSKLFLLVLLLIIVVLAACSKKPNNYKRKEVIFLELNSDLSVVSDYTKHFQNGVKLALDEINMLGGINGKKVLIFHRNDFINYLEAKKAILDYKNSNVLAAFGTFFSDADNGAANGAEEASIPFLSTGYSDNPVYITPNNYSYRLRPGMQSMLKALALEAKAIGNLNRWLIITYSNQEGRAAGKVFEQQLIDLSNNSVSKSSAKSNKQKTTVSSGFLFNYLYISPFKASEYLNIKDLNKGLAASKAVLIITNGKDLQGLIDKAKLKQRLMGKIVFAPFAGDPEWLQYSNMALTPENWIVTGYPWYAINTNAHKSFYNKYYGTFRLQPRYASLLGYISVYMLVNSAKNLNLDNPDIYALREEFNKNLSNVVLKNTPLGEIAIRKDHTSTLGVYTGLLNIFSQRIIGNNGARMVLKDIRMGDVAYYDSTKVAVPLQEGLKIRKINTKKEQKLEKKLNKQTNNRERKLYDNGKLISIN